MSIEIGQKGEELATEYLKNLGYKIIARNYLTRVGEIDVIVTKNNQIIFVEVKYRRDEGYGTAVDCVTKSKLKKILKAAKLYLYENDLLDVDWRIDVAAIDQEAGEIEYLENVYLEGMKY